MVQNKLNQYKIVIWTLKIYFQQLFQNRYKHKIAHFFKSCFLRNTIFSLCHFTLVSDAANDFMVTILKFAITGSDIMSILIIG